MKALAIVPGTAEINLIDRPFPSIKAADEVRLKVLEVGICGTDREEASGGRARAPEGHKDLVLGHEMLGEVVEAGENVTRVKSGDLAVFTVRRGCGKCMPCAVNRSDMCRTGDYLERGIRGLDGYQSEHVVDSEQYIISIPAGLRDLGVLCEPLSVAEKAISESIRLQSARLPDAAASPNWLHGRRCLITGLGPIGILAAVALRLRGAEVFGLDIVEGGSVRPAWFEGIGGKYVDGRKVSPDRVDDTLGEVDLIFEATGVPALAFNIFESLSEGGICVLTGIPGGNRPIEIPGAELMRGLVLNNQVIVGSVNASRDHYQMAVDDLIMAQHTWGSHMDGLITHRHSYPEFDSALKHHGQDEIKGSA